MNKEAINTVLKEMPKTQFGAALKLHLEYELEKLDSVDGVKTIEEVRGKQLAKEIIKTIFSFYPQGSIDRKKKDTYT